MIQLCLSVTRAVPGCEDSASQGTLESVFLSTASFGLFSDYLFSLRDAGVGQPDVDQPWCVDPAGLTQCRGADISGIAPERFSLAATFTPSTTANLSWSGLGVGSEAALGCFLLKGSPYFRAEQLVQGLRMGVTYKDTDATGTPSRMVGSVCGPALAALNLSTSLPLRTVSTPLPRGDVDRLGQSGVVCTTVEVQRATTDALRVCLRTTNSALANPICSGSSGSGRLTGVFFGAEPFGVPAVQLGVENGAIKAARPYCSGSDNLVECQGVDIRSTLAGGPGFDVGFALASPVTFGTANADLGCFYITNFASALLDRAEGWSVGLSFDQLSGGKTSKMISTLYSPAALPPVDPCPFNTVNARMPVATVDSGSDLVCTKVDVVALAANELQVCMPPFSCMAPYYLSEIHTTSHTHYLSLEQCRDRHYTMNL